VKLALAFLLLQVPRATLDVQLPSGAFELGDAPILAWVESSARATAQYFGGFPAPRPTIEIHVGDGSGVGYGTANGFDGQRIDITVGKHVSKAALSDDWVLTHEMVHLGFPTLARRHHWMEEGLATYVEPFARARIGTLDRRKVWGDLVAGLPQGLPQKGDHGLDHTPTWGRTYWGGCLFYLLADIETRKQSGNAKGLEHALRAIVAAGGTIGNDWTIDKVISVGDGATGTKALRTTYDRMKDRPAPVDLDALWKQLGVVVQGGSVTFDDAAPLAKIRRAITTG
jgi:hypothetical protein